MNPEGFPQVIHIAAYRTARIPGQVVSPQCCYELVMRDNIIGIKQKHRKQRSLARP